MLCTSWRNNCPLINFVFLNSKSVWMCAGTNIKVHNSYLDFTMINAKLIGCCMANLWSFQNGTNKMREIDIFVTHNLWNSFKYHDSQGSFLITLHWLNSNVFAFLLFDPVALKEWKKTSSPISYFLL